MKICLICNQIAAWGKIGGFGTNARRLGGALVERGAEVHAVVLRRPEQRKVEELDGMTVHGQSTLEVLLATDLYRDLDADIYHALEPTTAAANAFAATPGRVHLVTSMDPRDSHDWRVEFRNATWSRRLKTPLQYYYENGRRVHAAVRAADGVYVEAEFLQQKTRDLYGLSEAPGLLPKPVAVPGGPFVKDERPLCVFLGRFDPRKRPELFFEVVKRMPDVDFVAIGRAHDATYQSHLERHYFDLPNLTVTGILDGFANPQLHEILSRAWILVHPAAREGLPTAFQEASAREVAILAYVDPGDYVSKFGRVASEDRGVQGLESDLRELIDSGAWRAMGVAGREYNLRHHSIPVSTERHFQVYERHLEQKHIG
ncbi:MAG: hypothetical protein CL933_02010 [Deltaproteobacteria bacterium]|nr:hypothetical protein [Deltaproteobacteria bacterium]